MGPTFLHEMPSLPFNNEGAVAIFELLPSLLIHWAKSLELQCRFIFHCVTLFLAKNSGVKKKKKKKFHPQTCLSFGSIRFYLRSTNQWSERKKDNKCQVLDNTLILFGWVLKDLTRSWKCVKSGVLKRHDWFYYRHCKWHHCRCKLRWELFFTCLKCGKLIFNISFCPRLAYYIEEKWW